ncbi:hypothetical protein CO172_03315 [Candidatus Uhrbacteria bacterium CG_4_9_14_3_um_filter_36_7]|uniref:Uncharacterized protein n=1 Tax=Candidatus Uhrbacteria bacterium CG_4_9_14_3_um_filter_36_7 TaxID=1975033 RepID=A0A2M7XGF7_9BACT|nr:MAG: hypothetical protein CO172_03315 [Candidatus Uhrbacteria bacterium CG_4_9_14_3_um_filter_36_7]
MTDYICLFLFGLLVFLLVVLRKVSKKNQQKDVIGQIVYFNPVDSSRSQGLNDDRITSCGGGAVIPFEQKKTKRRR